MPVLGARCVQSPETPHQCTECGATIGEGEAAIRLFGSAHGGHWHNLWLHPDCYSYPSAPTTEEVQKEVEKVDEALGSAPEGFPLPDCYPRSSSS